MNEAYFISFSHLAFNSFQRMQNQHKMLSAENQRNQGMEGKCSIWGRVVLYGNGSAVGHEKQIIKEKELSVKLPEH